MIVASLLFIAGSNMTLNQNDLTSLTVLSAVVFLNGSFIAVFGIKAFKAALFPLLFLVFAVPIPSGVMDNIILFLQVGSTEFRLSLHDYWHVLCARGVCFSSAGDEY